MARFTIIALLFAVGASSAFVAQNPAPNEMGVLPSGPDGKPLNLDFETGTLKDWIAQGDAFKNQPIKGDTVYPRRGDNKSQHQGDYWIGGYEKHGDKPQGTLTSIAFKVTHPWASFLVGGGSGPTTCVELVRKDTGEVIQRASGTDEENLQRVVVDLKALNGKEIFIRLVDKSSGGWGHINFDDFRFHAAMPNFQTRPAAAAPDIFKYAGLPPKTAAEVMTVPDGFKVKLFAGEPDVQQPIAFCIDDRGRLWVAEAYTYPQRAPEGKGKDRILIFEDTDGDGVFDKRTVFMENLNLVSGLEVGFGGVWIGAAPYLMFVPVKAGEDRPAGPPQILLDGWGWQDTHETLNTFTWGPDGWLYGCHGVFTHSRVGKPGTADKNRVPINAGIWRYHPTRHVFEVFAHGTSNPWGLDFDDCGQAFIEACVIPHNWHIIQNARYQRQGGTHFNPYTYADISTIAEHRHYLGANPHGGNGRSDSAGGGHAHCGAMIYLGGTWPADYRGKMFMGNIHGCRLNIDLLAPTGSGFVASRHPDFLLANDSWARFINLQYGPDGNVYLIDWYDKQACHTGNVQIWDRSNGRIYKICHKDAQGEPAVDLTRLTDLELVGLQDHANDWYARHARRLLQERWIGGDHEKNPAVTANLVTRALKHKEEPRRLRAIWALHAIGGLTEELTLKLLADKGHYVRGWVIQLAIETGLPSPKLMQALTRLAKTDPSPVARLYLASALQRLPVDERQPILSNLVAHGEDAGDHNLPLMYWYAAEPLGGKDPGAALDLALAAKTPSLCTFMTRRIASTGNAVGLLLIVDRLSKLKDPDQQVAVLRGLQNGLEGRRSVPMPIGWHAAYTALTTSKKAEVRSAATALAVTFGDPKALESLRQVLASTGEDTPTRQQALTALIAAQDKEVVPVLHTLLAELSLRGAALRALAGFDDPKTPDAVLRVYGELSTAERRDALNTLASRPSYGKALMEAVAAKKIPSSEVSAEVVRQLRNLGDKALDARIAEVWGLFRVTPADRAKAIASWNTFLSAPAKTDVSLGRAIFAKTCQQCHILYGVGGKVGPDITGANRSNLGYLLENILDPSAVIPKEYTSTVIELHSGRVVTGIVKGETPAALTVVTANENLTISRSDIVATKPSNISMMPEDLLAPLTKDEVRALIGYLMSPSQTPILLTADNAKDFFSGKDLVGWEGDPAIWRVEKGEIVGQGRGLKEPAFLRSQFTAHDFRLKFQAKVSPAGSGGAMVYRGDALPDGGLSGLSASLGAGRWGQIQYSSGLLVPAGPTNEVSIGEKWAEVEILADGPRVRILIDGKVSAERVDPVLSRPGVFGLQLLPGQVGEVRFRGFQLERIEAKK
jgi:putative membrane-bound dehydrogenase-like protein